MQSHSRRKLGRLQFAELLTKGWNPNCIPAHTFTNTGQITNTDFVEIQRTPAQETNIDIRHTNTQWKNIEITRVANNVQPSQPHITNALMDPVSSSGNTSEEAAQLYCKIIQTWHMEWS